MQRLLTPGPVPVPPAILKILSQPIEHHRTAAFLETFRRVKERLQKVFATVEPVYIQATTGTGGMESAMVNTLSPGDHIIVVVSGKFGERWAQMGEVYGLKVHRFNVEWGAPLKVTEFENFYQSASKQAPIAAVFTQVSETSTGTLHPVQALGKFLSGTPSIFAVDAITALGAMPLPMDEWNLDVVVGGSQKAFMLPAGLSFIAFSKKAWGKVLTANLPRYYLDIRLEEKASARGETAFSSPAVLIRALDGVLELFEQNGMPAVHARIATLAQATYEAMNVLGLKIFSRAPSPTVTAIEIPQGINGEKLRDDIERAGVVLMGGQDHLKGKILRLGHMGYITDDDMAAMLRSLVDGLNIQSAGMVGDLRLQDALQSMKSVLAKQPIIDGSR